MSALLPGLRPYFALVLLCLALYLPGLAALPPLDRDESRFAQASKQMIESGDYVRIQFQKDMRAKKPVGAYWLQAGVTQILGEPPYDEIWTYRLPSALAATAAVVMLFGFGKAVVGRGAALLAAAFTAAALLLVLEAHQAKTDAILLACVVAAQGALARFYLQDKGGRKPGQMVALAFWLAQGCGILVKGPMVPLLSLLTIAALLVADRKAAWLRGLRPVTGLLVAAAVVGPWAAAITQATGGEFVGAAIKSDLLPKLLGAQEAHGAPPGYYLLLAPLMFWPASLFVVPALVAAWRDRQAAAVRFCLAWVGPAWVMFELVPTKLPHYVLPTYPALALLTALAVVAAKPVLASRGARAGYVAWGALGLAVAVAAVVTPFVYGTGFAWWSVPAAAAALVAGVVPPVLAWRGRLLAASGVAVAAAGVTFVCLFHGVAPGFERLWVSARVAAAVEQVRPHGQVAIAGFSEPSLIFRLGTDTQITTGTGAAEHLATQPGALAVVDDAEMADFTRAQAASGRHARELGAVAGLNYSRGRAVVLHILAAEAP